MASCCHLSLVKILHYQSSVQNYTQCRQWKKCKQFERWMRHKERRLLRGTASLMVLFVQEKLSKSLPSVVVRSRSRNAGGRGDCLPKRPVGWGYLFRFFFNQAFSLLALAGSVSELRDTGLDYLGEVKRTLISAATKEAVCDAHFSQLSNMALFIIQ